MSIVLIANIISFLGAGLMVLIGFIKDNKKVLTAQCLQFTLMGFANFMLGAFTGSISNVIGILRNIYSIKKPMSMKVKVIFIIIQVALSVVAGLNGYIGWLPILATVAFTFFVDTDNETIMKCVIIFGQLLWFIYDIHFSNYAAAAFDILTCATNAYTILVLHLKKRETSLS